MTVSVCMALYNGEKYIREQLLSIAEQTREPDEVILCDDNSTDGTVETVKKFIAERRLEDRWILYQNQENKGYPGNFYYAMSLCRGDIVFLSDQDDIWHPDKIARMCDVLDKHSEIEVLACKFGLINETGQGIHTIMAPSHTKETANLRNISIQDVFYKCEWGGMVMAYRKIWYDERCMAEACQGIPHDFFLYTKAAEEGKFVQMDEELAWHRRHNNNTGWEEHRIFRLLNKGRKLKEIENYLKNLYQMDQDGILQTESGKQALAEKIASQQGRYRALQSGKIREVIKEAWKHRGEVRPATVICDVLIVKQEG